MRKIKKIETYYVGKNMAMKMEKNGFSLMIQVLKFCV